MGMALIFVGLIIVVIGVLAVTVTATNTIALAVSLLLCIFGAILLGAGVITESIDKLRRATLPPKQPKA